MGVVWKYCIRARIFGGIPENSTEQSLICSCFFPVEEVVYMNTCYESPPWLMYSDFLTLVKEKYGRRFLKVIWKNCSTES